MSMTVEQLEAEIRNLPADDQAQLIDRVLAALDVTFAPDSETLDELEQRAEELASGQVQGIPAEVFFARVRAQLR